MENKKIIKKKKDQVTTGEFLGGAGVGSLALETPGNIGAALTLKNQNVAQNGIKGNLPTFDEMQKAATGKIRGRNDLVFMDTGKLSLEGLSGKKGNKNIPQYIHKGTIDGRDVIVSQNGNVGLTAHELGHSSSPFLKLKNGHKIYGASKSLSRLGGVAGILSGAAGHEATKGEVATSLLASSPLLAEETRANIIAAKAAYKLGGRKGLLAALPTIAGSELSYLGSAGGFTGGNYVANKVRGWIHGNKDKKKSKK